jgi:hypothetical protein
MRNKRSCLTIASSGDILVLEGVEPTGSTTTVVLLGCDVVNSARSYQCFGET